MAFPFVLFYQEYIENVVGAAIGRIDLDKRVYTLKKCYLLDNDPRLD